MACSLNLYRSISLTRPIMDLTGSGLLPSSSLLSIIPWASRIGLGTVFLLDHGGLCAINLWRRRHLVDDARGQRGRDPPVEGIVGPSTPLPLREAQMRHHLRVQRQVSPVDSSRSLRTIYFLLKDNDRPTADGFINPHSSSCHRETLFSLLRKSYFPIFRPESTIG